MNYPVALNTETMGGAMAKETAELLEFLRSVVRAEPETGQFYWIVDLGRYKIGDPAGNNNPYRMICLRWKGGRARVSLHRMMWAFVTGTWPVKEIDHKNLNIKDNRISNLREATPSQNKVNRRVRKDSKTGLKGVSLHRRSGLWRARIGADGFVVGYFKTPEDAHAAYIAAARERYGEYFRVG